MKLDKKSLLEGDYVKVIKSGKPLEVFNDRYSPEKDYTDCEFEGQDISFALLKDILGFEEQYSRDKSGILSSKAIMSVKSGDLYYTVSVDIGNLGGYILLIEVYGEVLCRAQVEYVHQVQNIMSTIIV